MTRKRSHRRVIVPLPPRGLRPRLSPDQLRFLGLTHVANLDALASGQANEATLWRIVASCLTWSRAAELTGVGIEEMREQLDLATNMVERFGHSGRLLFTDAEYQLAKHGVLVMDLLAEQVDRPTAIAAAEWGGRRLDEMKASCRARPKKAA